MNLVSALDAAEWRKLWALKIQHRLKLMMWKVAADALPLCSKVCHFVTNIGEAAMACPLCSQAEEIAHYLFLGCHFSRILWRGGPWAFDPAAFSQEPISHWMKFILKPSNMPANDKAS